MTVYRRRSQSRSKFDEKSSHAEYSKPRRINSGIVLTLLLLFTIIWIWVMSSFYSPTPPSDCPPPSPMVIRAINRTKTAECRSSILSTACALNSSSLYSARLSRSSCPLARPGRLGSLVGCFRHSPAQFTHAQFWRPVDNDPLGCAQTCLNLAAPLSAVQNASWCFCGKREDLLFWPVPTELCMNETLRCPGNASLHCGGSSHMAVRETGLGDASLRLPLLKDPENVAGQPLNKPRILFFFQISSRNSRHFRRVLKLLYRPQHFYFVHVDSRNEFLQREMLDIEALFKSRGQDNFLASRRRWATVWGGMSGLEMSLEVTQDLLELWPQWELMMLLTESDLLLVPLDELEDAFAANPGMSFITTMPRNKTKEFIHKQGVTAAFVECDERVWKVGHKALPQGVAFAAGDQWMTLRRDFAAYAALSSDTTAVALRAFYAHSAIPFESFHHTLALNSAFCDRVVHSALKAVNWDRRRGCRCPSKVIDWCGCSPMVYRKEHFAASLAPERNRPRMILTARKFDPEIDQEVVALVEAEVRGRRPHPALQAAPSAFSALWITLFDRETDSESKGQVFRAIASLHSTTSPATVRSAHVYRANDSLPNQLLVHWAPPNGSEHEGLFERRRRWSEGAKLPDAELEEFSIGKGFDAKEGVFRNHDGLVRPTDEATVYLRWATKTNASLDGLSLDIADPNLDLFASHRLNGTIQAGNTSRNFALQSNGSSLAVGEWSATLGSETETLAQLAFTVFDASFEGPVEEEWALLDSCSLEGERSCSETPWSSHHPDPKSDLAFGWDAESQVYL